MMLQLRSPIGDYRNKEELLRVLCVPRAMTCDSQLTTHYLALAIASGFLAGGVNTKRQE